MKALAPLRPYLAAGLFLLACDSATETSKTCAGQDAAMFRELLASREITPAANIHILNVRPYPLVSGLNQRDSAFREPGEDVYLHDSLGFSLWIPPVGFNTTPLPLDSIGSTRDITNWVPQPDTVSAVQVVSDGSFIVSIRIFDTGNRLIRSSTQQFGSRGELMNPARVVPTGFLSFLYWDGRETGGNRAVDGIYTWKIAFLLKGGQQYDATLKTGLRNGSCAEN